MGKNLTSVIFWSVGESYNRGSIVRQNGGNPCLILNLYTGFEKAKTGIHPYS